MNNSLRRTRRSRAVASVFAALSAGTTTLALMAGPASATNNYALLGTTFTGSSEPAGQWMLPTPGSGTDVTCLTAGSSSTTSSIPACGGTADANGSGALRLTSNAMNEIGSTFYSLSLPTSEGLDISFNTYQYNTTTATGSTNANNGSADGIAFDLAAVNPADPTPPSITGPDGGALGYEPSKYGTAAATAGIANGYLGVGLDTFGNFTNEPTFGGTGCTEPSALTANDEYPEAVTVDGPGNSTAGYCILSSTAITNHNVYSGTGLHNAVSNINGGTFIDSYLGTTRSTATVPVEVVLNPGSSAVTGTTSGVSVPAGDYLVAFEPVGTSTWQTLVGALPTSTTASSIAALPSSWVNSTTGLPYQIDFGWTASTGGATEIHEVTGLQTASVNAVDPQLTLSNSDNGNLNVASGGSGTVVLDPGVGTQANEGKTVTLTDTFPTGETPGTATAPSGWTCSTSGQVVTCTDTVGGTAIPAGTSLPDISVPVTVSAASGTVLKSTAILSSDDALPTEIAQTTTVSAPMAASTSVGTNTATYGSPVTLTSSGLPSGATGTVTFTSGGKTLCTATVSNGSASCATSSTLTGGTYPVTSTYSGDTNDAAQTATTSFTVAMAASTSVGTNVDPNGSPVTLNATGLPTNASGTVTFSSGGKTLCTATVSNGSASCPTSSTLAPGSYPVTSSYSGDSSHSAETATTSFVVGMVASTSVGTNSAAYGSPVTITASGLPSGATGTVTFTSGGTTLCTAKVSNGSASCPTSSTLPVGSYPVTSSYSGDSNNKAETATTSFTVVKAAAAPITGLPGSGSTGSTPSATSGSSTTSPSSTESDQTSGTSLNLASSVASPVGTLTYAVAPTSAPGACSISNGTVKFGTPGTCVVDVTDSGDANHAGTTVQAIYIVKPAIALVTLGPLRINTNTDKFSIEVTCKRARCTGLANVTVARHIKGKPGRFKHLILAGAHFNLAPGHKKLVQLTTTPLGVSVITKHIAFWVHHRGRYGMTLTTKLGKHNPKYHRVYIKVLKKTLAPTNK